SINPENVVVVDATEAGNHRVIAEVDWDSAFTAVHTDAIYMMESQQYYVDKLENDYPLRNAEYSRAHTP
ncbi:MAG: hypothetical protein MUC63_09165, partial [Planctomycetes bacterium]|nr:hypothetical protein [Planctomycetota bacterium]